MKSVVVALTPVKPKEINDPLASVIAPEAIQEPVVPVPVVQFRVVAVVVPGVVPLFNVSLIPVVFDVALEKYTYILLIVHDTGI